MPQALVNNVVTAGFLLTYEDSFHSKATETSNASIYGLTIQRVNVDGSLHPDDAQIPALRLTQTVGQLSTMGNAQQLLDATVTDAKGMIEQAGIVVDMTAVSTSERTILGAAMTGVRIPFTVGEGEDAVESALDCFGFEHSSGKGVGMILKVGTTGETGMLEHLKVLAVDADSVYTCLIAGYPVGLPVMSRVESIRQVSEYGVEAGVTMQHAGLTLQIARVPDEYNIDDTLFEQAQGYEKMVSEQDEAGALHLQWSSTAYVPQGNSGTGLIEAPVYAIEAEGQALISSMYSAADDRILIMANYTATTENVSAVPGYARALFSKMGTDTSPQIRDQHMPGFVMDIPVGYRVWELPTDGVFDTYLIAPHMMGDANAVLDGAVQRKPFTRLKFLQAGHPETLESVHKALCLELMNRHSEAGEEPESFGGAIAGETVTLEDGRVVESVSSGFVPLTNPTTRAKAGNGYHDLIVQSYLLPSKNGESDCIVSTVSNKWLFAGADMLSREMLGWISRDDDVETIPLPFGVLEYEPLEGVAYTWYSDWFGNTSGELGTILEIGNDRIQIKTNLENDDVQVLSRRRLADRYIREQWVYQSNDHEEHLYPENSDGLADCAIAGFPGSMFETVLRPPAEWEAGMRAEPKFVRIYGLSHGNRYSTIVITQRNDIDPARADRWIEGLRSVSDD